MTTRKAISLALTGFLVAAAGRAGAAPNLYAVVVADTFDPKIGKSVQSDSKHIKSDLRRIASAAKMSLRLTVLEGENATGARLQSALARVRPGPNDAVVFYYSGHGSRTADKTSPWPDMNLRDGPFDLLVAFRALYQKNPRLLVVAADCCNAQGGRIAVSEEPDVTAEVEPRATPQIRLGYHKLFADSRLALITSSARPTELAYGPESGGLFTNRLRNMLNSAGGMNAPSWRGVMERSARPIKTSAGLQHPIYKIYKMSARPVDSAD